MKHALAVVGTLKFAYLILGYTDHFFCTWKKEWTK